MVADLNMLGLVGDLYCFSNTLRMLVKHSGSIPRNARVACVT